MRVALCFSGQPRNVELGHSHINPNILEPNILAGHHIDVFVHTWFSQENARGGFRTSGGLSADSSTHDDVLSLIHRLYNPAMMLVERPNTFSHCNDGRYNRKLRGIVPGNSVAQRYSIKRSFGLVEEYLAIQNQNYDAILRMRMDWGIAAPFLFDDHPLERITIPNDGAHGGFNDQFAFGSPELMYHYGTLFDHMDRWYNEGTTFVDELLLRRHLEGFGVPISPTPIGYTLLRT